MESFEESVVWEVIRVLRNQFQNETLPCSKWYFRPGIRYIIQILDEAIASHERELHSQKKQGL